VGRPAAVAVRRRREFEHAEGVAARGEGVAELVGAARDGLPERGVAADEHVEAGVVLVQVERPGAQRIGDLEVQIAGERAGDLRGRVANRECVGACFGGGGAVPGGVGVVREVDLGVGGGAVGARAVARRARVAGVSGA
jgi:hypothetical protein